MTELSLKAVMFALGKAVKEVKDRKGAEVAWTVYHAPKALMYDLQAITNRWYDEEDIKKALWELQRYGYVESILEEHSSYYNNPNKQFTYKMRVWRFTEKGKAKLRELAGK
jgi:hypothetical protein